jgi:hypothetical protein
MSGRNAEIHQLKASVSSAVLLERLPPVWRLDRAETHVLDVNTGCQKKREQRQECSRRGIALCSAQRFRHHPGPEKPIATALPDGHRRPETGLTWPTGLLTAAETPHRKPKHLIVT